MSLLGWRKKSWRQRAVLIATLILVCLLLAHPELRLLAPIVDALGLDMLLLLMASQLHEYLRPVLSQFLQYANPAALFLYALCIYLLGHFGPYVDGYLRTEFRRPPANLGPVGVVQDAR